MKTQTNFYTILVTMVIMLTASTSLFSQMNVDEDLRVKEWIDGQTITVFDHHVTRVFGETYDRSERRNLHIPITNIGFKDLDQLIEETRAEAKVDGWDEGKLKEEIENLKETAPGGRLYVYVERRENDRANGKFFFTIIRDKDEQEFFKYSFETQAPEFGDFGFWGNLFTVNIPNPLALPFFVYVNDRGSGHLSDFKFEVLPLKQR